MAEEKPPSLSGDMFFPSTCWGQIQGGSATEDAEALETLARRYWRPIHAWIRVELSRRDQDARDLTQEFFAWVIESGFLGKADPSRGRFRAFLKTALRRWVTDEDRKRLAAKRGGGRRFVPLAEEERESGGHGALVVDSNRTPEENLDAEWRANVIMLALERVRNELEGSDRAVVWAVFAEYFMEKTDELDYRALAEKHGISRVDVSNYLQRAKKLYRARLQDLVADTVRTPADLDEELAWLLGDGS